MSPFKQLPNSVTSARINEEQKDFQSQENLKDEKF